MIVRRLQTFIMVSIVTLLVWAYAEGQNLKTLTTDISARLVYPTDRGLRIRPVGNGNPTFTLELAGATQAVKRFEFGTERSGLELEVGRYGLSLVPGTHQVPVTEILEQHEMFRGLSIRSVDPQLLLYTVERLVDYELPVVSPDLSGIGINAEVTFTPSVVSVNLSEALLNEILEQRGAEGLFLQAVLNAERLRTLERGRPQTMSANLVFPMVANTNAFTLSSETVQATVTIRSQTRQTTVSQVPIWLSLPPTDQDRYTIQLAAPFVPQVELTGAGDTITGFENGDLRLKAVLELSSTELTRGITEKTVSYYRLADNTSLPAGVQIVSEPFTATFTITRRDDSE